MTESLSGSGGLVSGIGGLIRELNDPFEVLPEKVERVLFDPTGKVLPKDPRETNRDAVKEAKRVQAIAQEKAAKEQQKEAARLALATDDVARRKAASGPGKAGRSLLIATSPTGTRSTNLGGTS